MNEYMNTLVPTVIERSGNGERAYDLYSRLLKDRIIFVDGEIRDETADLIVAQSLDLESETARAVQSLPDLQFTTRCSMYAVTSRQSVWVRQQAWVPLFLQAEQKESAMPSLQAES